jgi:hypothetical protein
MRFHSSLRFATTILLTLILALPALAGPPLICHRLEIGSAKSLPWTGTAWNLSGDENYDTRNLVRDTLAILDSAPPVLVRMETLRRATLYAAKDQQAAKELLTRLHARVDTRPTDALAWFDAGYLAAAYGQWLKPNPAAGLDAYSLIQKAIAIRGNDPEMEFAAALVTLRGPEKDHQEHVQRAVAGAKTDPLLAQNLSSQFFGSEKQTVSEVLSKNTGGEQK